MCAPCYGTWWRQNNQTEQACQHCGSTFNAGRKQAYCSATCQRTAASNSPVRIASLKNRPKKTPTPRMSEAELTEMYRAKRSAIRAAYEDQNWEALTLAIRARSTETPLGCWEWGGRLSGGYPVINMAKRMMLVHRISLEAKHQASLGEMLSHHTCANSKCVNPMHLQPATHAENVGEMKARVSYERRITALEEALYLLDPSNPLLAQIPTRRAASA